MLSYQAVINQPFFANSLSCDWFEVSFDSPLTTGANAPLGVHGVATVTVPPLPGTMTFDGVYGINVAYPFIEHNFQLCKSVSGN